MKFSLTVILFLLTAFAVNAQKLPAKQLASLRLPENARIDGTANEWSGKFAAYNKSTRLFYSIANSNGYIYLIAQTTDAETIRKIITYGLAFTVNSATKKAIKPLQLTTPVFGEVADQKVILTCLNFTPSVFIKDTAVLRRRLDTIVYAMNENLNFGSVAMSVTGLPLHKDTLLNNNNRLGLAASSLFENQQKYTIELAIPIKYLPADAEVLSYNIKVNGTPAKNVPIVRSGIVALSPADAMRLQQMSNNAPRPVIDAPADFSGEYTMMKK